MTTLAVRLIGRVGAFHIDVTLAAPPGVTVLQGPSGSGKTTLLRAIAGLEGLQGEVRIGANIWQDRKTFVPPHRRRIGFVFQGANLLPHLSVHANLAYAARRAAAPLAIADVADRMGFTPLLDRFPAALSGGESQRIALGRALLTRPDLLLLDEPLAALDREARSMLIGVLGAALPTLAIPVLLVTHEPAEVAPIATQTLQMAKGVLA